MVLPSLRKILAVPCLTNLLFRFLLLAISAPIFAQSYETSFAAQKYDRTQGISSMHGGVAIDGATGALSMSVPLGLGIGARGAFYRPTIATRWAPSSDVSANQTNSPGGVGYTVGQLDCQTGSVLYPGHFDLLLNLACARPPAILNSLMAPQAFLPA